MKVPSVPLPNLAEKTTVDHLEAFLRDPLKERPSSRMPNLGLSHDEARSIAVYLLRDQLTNPQVAKGEKARLPESNLNTTNTRQPALPGEHRQRKAQGNRKPATISRSTFPATAKAISP